ncbi:hypothetical protein ACA910_013135 [Epithemia clementina (nom. ined.)]
MEDDQDNNHDNNNDQITPHMERLLRLIREGSPDMLDAAQDQLYHSCSNNKTPVLLWRILGCMQSTLCGLGSADTSSWKARVQTAQALERIAQLVPLKDQYQFWRQQQQPSTTELEEAEKQNQQQLSSSSSTNNAEESNKIHSNSHTYLSLEQAENLVLWNDLLRRGRPLYVTAASKWEQDQVALEQDMLHEITQAGTVNENNSNNNSPFDVVRRRTAWQREQLAKRLGLNALVVAEQDTAYLVDNDADDAFGEGEESNDNKKKKGRKTKKAKEPKSGTGQRRKRQRVKKNDTAVDDEATKKRSIRDVGFRNLLVLELQRSMDETKELKTKATSQLNPQQLLATEFLYRMLDPLWQVRHGALLGLLALVRAWQQSLAAVIEQHQHQTMAVSLLWPEDLLVRAMAIFVLDRFGDFSGGVVAPIRETAGQLVALLFTLFPLRQRTRILDVLEHLLSLAPGHDTTGEPANKSAEKEDIWEIRQGVLAAFKYSAVLLWRNMERASALSKHVSTTISDGQGSTKHSSEFVALRPILRRITRIAVERLGDQSDDVVSVAAQILREITNCVTSPFAPDDVDSVSALVSTRDVVPQLYRALHQAQSFSSSVPDLVALLSELLACNSDFGKALVESHRLSDTFQMLSKFLASDYESVQVSALTSLGSLSSAIGTTYHRDSPGESDNGQTLNEGTQDLLVTCNQIVLRLFHFMLQHGSKCPSEVSPVAVQMESTWQQLCKIFTAQLFAQNTEAFLGLEKHLYLSFFCHQIMRSLTDNFGIIDKACEMLAFFSRTNTVCFPSRSLSYFLTVSFQAPWLVQCEAACVLSRHLAKCGDQSLLTVQAGLQTVMNDDPLCIRIWQSLKDLDVLADPSVLSLCDEAMGRGIERIFTGQELSSSVQCVAAVWEETFRLRTSLDDTSNVCRAVDVELMRLRASASAATLGYGTPGKITSYVRCLVSSLRSEGSEQRLKQTVQALVSLMASIESSVSHGVAYSKIMKALCNAAIKESRGLTTVKHYAACEGVRGVVRNASISQLTGKSCPIWTWLNALRTGESSDECILEAIHLAWVLCFIPDGSDPSRFFETKFVAELTTLCLSHDSEEVRTTASSVVQCICSSKSSEPIKLALETLFKCMDQELLSGHQRKRGCLLLETIVNASASGFLPFVRSLFPIVMKLMRDRDPVCSRAATSIFSSLVQLAPLVRMDESISIFSSHDSHTSAVIDHLILGKPIPPCELPSSINDCLNEAGVSLRTYQKEGVSWLHFLQSVHLSGALCDSMGLGKTLQALLAIALAHSTTDQSEQAISLIVSPSTLVNHWMSEVQRFFPGSSVFRPAAFSGSTLSRKQTWLTLLSNHNLVITSYSVLRSDIEMLERKDWTYCVLDEGHLLKNPKTATSRASRRIKADQRLILSGTMIQNRVGDLWAAFDFLMPNFLGSANDFWKQYGGPIKKSFSNSATAKDINDGMGKLKALHQKVLPFILRREKETVLKELPPKNIVVLKCSMSQSQEKIYNAFCASAEMKESIRALEQETERQNDRVEIAVGSTVLRSLLFLRLLCTHPSLVATKERERKEILEPSLRDSGKLLALVGLLGQIGINEDIPSGADNDTSIFYCEEEGEEQEGETDSITGSTSYAPLASGGWKEAEEKSSKCLIFAQFVQSLDVVEQALLNAKLPSVNYLRLDGAVPASQRVAIAEQFNADPEIKILLLTTRVGSLGLNLTGADTVIFLEHDWNPFQDLQAMDRAHRIGQTNTVNVFRLVMQGTIEERILDLQQKKTAMSDAVVNSENSSLYSLGTDRLLDIFKVENRSNEKTSNEGSCEFDLESLLERYGVDYTSSLSVSEFVRQSQPHDA